MERLTNKDHKEIGFCSYAGTQNPFKTPLTIGEIAGCLNVDYSPRKILEDILGRLAAYEDTGLEPEEIDSVFIHGVIEENQRLKELAKAEKDGRLVVLPCKVGDTVYEANKRGFVSTYEVISIHVSHCSVLFGWNLVDGTYSNLNGFEASALGKTVFLTREEAEAALKKREEAASQK